MSKKILGSVNSEQNEQDELDREYIKRIKSGDNIALNYIMDKYKNFVFSKSLIHAWLSGCRSIEIFGKV